MILGIAGGIGFALLENVILLLGPGEYAETLRESLLRAFLSVPAHGLWGAITGVRFALQKYGYGEDQLRQLTVIRPFCDCVDFMRAFRKEGKAWSSVTWVAIVLHGFWDFPLMLMEFLVVSYTDGNKGLVAGLFCLMGASGVASALTFYYLLQSAASIFDQGTLCSPIQEA